MDRLRHLFSMVWIGVCATAMLEQSRMLQGRPADLSWLEVYVFCGTVFGYHFTHPDKLYRILAWLMVIPAGLGYWFTSLPWWVMLTPALGWVAYYGFEKNGKTGLRSGIWAKPIAVGITWAWVTVVLPLYPDNPATYLFLFLERTLFIIALALAYDLSDAEYDRAQGFGTLALTMGKRQTFRLIYCCLAASGIMAFAQGYSMGHTLAIGLTLLWAALWLPWILSKPSWHAWHKPLIDGVMVFWCLSV
ncbi:MAG TPA: hypothetical protein DCF33_08535, partial [Saprospirales bacterium]|nr:hypothetical protein [Saprospirales bacterium]